MLFMTYYNFYIYCTKKISPRNEKKLNILNSRRFFSIELDYGELSPNFSIRKYRYVIIKELDNFNLILDNSQALVRLP